MNKRTLPPGCLMSICFLALLLCLLSHRLALVWKHSALSSCVVIPLVWCLLALKFLQDPYLKITPPFFFFFLDIATISLMTFLIGFIVNPVNSCTTEQLSLAGIYCLQV